MRLIKVGDDASYEDTADNDETDTDYRYRYPITGAQHTQYALGSFEMIKNYFIRFKIIVTIFYINTLIFLYL